MIDDYLNRNKYVVIKSLHRDELSVETLEAMKDMEKSDKKRKDVLKALDKKLKG